MLGGLQRGTGASRVRVAAYAAAQKIEYASERARVSIGMHEASTVVGSMVGHDGKSCAERHDMGRSGRRVCPRFQHARGSSAKLDGKGLVSTSSYRRSSSFVGPTPLSRLETYAKSRLETLSFLESLQLKHSSFILSPPIHFSRRGYLQVRAYLTPGACAVHLSIARSSKMQIATRR
jgi:hypothetical protein